MTFSSFTSSGLMPCASFAFCTAGGTFRKSSNGRRMMKPLTENALVLAAGVPTNVPSPDHPKRLKTRTASGALIVAFAIGTTTPAVCQDQLHGWKLISQSSAISLIGVEE